jgi:O-antigen/teichoic acid export membrane protein
VRCGACSSLAPLPEQAPSYAHAPLATPQADTLDAAEPLVRSRRESLKQSDTVRAAGMASAQLGANVVALIFTVVFARILGPTDYGSLGALLAAFLVVSVPGNALQVAAAREAALGRLGQGGALAATLWRWALRVAVVAAFASVLALLLREPIASVVNVDESFAAAAIVPTAFLLLIICLQRGALQGIGTYRPVAVSLPSQESGRLLAGLALAAAGLGVTGAYLGTPLTFVAVILALAWVTRRRLGPPPHEEARESLRDLLAVAWAPVVGLTLIAVLQNVDVIVAKHHFDGDDAGAYAAAGVAAKAVVWVAIGVGFYLVPEATRRAAAGQHPRQVLLRTLVVVGVLAVPALAIFAVVPDLLLELAFGPEYTEAADALVVLGLAMTFLAVTYLAVQYLLALGHHRFLFVLAGVAVADVLLLIVSGGDTLVRFAAVVLAAQAIGVVATLWTALRASPHPHVLSGRPPV